MYDEPVEINYSPNLRYIPNHPYRILIINGSGSGKTNTQILTNLLYVKDPL